MNINWFSTKENDLITTIDEKSITLNKYASTHFKDYKHVIVGFDEKQMYIKAVSVLEIDEKRYENADIFKITIANTYGRITSIELAKHIMQITKTNEKTKYKCEFNEDNKMLVVNLKKGDDK